MAMSWCRRDVWGIQEDGQWGVDGCAVDKHPVLRWVVVGVVVRLEVLYSEKTTERQAHQTG